MRLASCVILAVALLLAVGCGGNGSDNLADLPHRGGEARSTASNPSQRSRNANDEAATRRLADAPRRENRDADRETVATLGGRQVRWDDLRQIMIESAGADALGEWVLDKELDRALAERDLRLSEDDIERERRLLLEQLADDADDARRVLERVRSQRRLGETRFRLLLRRNAALRQLVAERVKVTDGMVRQLYEERFGPRTVARLIVSESVTEASRIKRRVDAGESFIDLAVELSIDPSGDRGGLLPPISPDDATFPEAIRDALDKLEVGEVSDPIAIDGGFALLRAERKLEPDDSVAFDDVADSLRREVRLRNERAAMQQRARMILEDAEVNVLDSRLNRAWQEHRRDILEQR